jgi:hypothetical protein
VGDLVGVLFVDAIERQAGEARGLCGIEPGMVELSPVEPSLVEIGIRHETSREKYSDEREPHHFTPNHFVTSL